MTDVRVEAAIKGLEALGLPITSSTPYLVDLLIQEGVDVLTTFPRIVHTVEQLGGNSWQVLEEVANGISLYGPVAYVQRTVENYFEPQVDKVRDIQLHKSILTDQHRTTLHHIQNQIATLHPTGGQASVTEAAFTGSAAVAMVDRLTEISAYFEKLMTAMDNSQQIDRDLQTDLQHVFELIAIMAIADLIIFAVVFIVVFVGSQLVLLIPEAALAPETGLVSIAVGGGASLGGAAGIAGGAVVSLLPEEGAIILGALIYAFGRWAVRHMMLDIAQPAAVSHSHALVPSKPILPKSTLTPEEAKLAEDLFKEFGGAIPLETLQYLAKVLGASKLSEAMIRCLYQSGYLDLSNSIYYPKSLTNAYDQAWTNITEHLTPNDLEGAWKEENPGEVDPSTIPPGAKYVSGGAHDEEVNAALKSIDKLIRSLDSKITDYNKRISYAPDPTVPNVLDMIDKRNHLQKLRDAFGKLRTFVQSKIAKGSPSPDTWSDQGKLPVVEDLLQVSSCKVPNARYYK